jgi:phosphoribosylglycinamide formyltransferase-1
VSINNKQIKVGVLVSGGGTNLQALIDANCNIVTVVSNKPGVYALERAKSSDIDATVIEKSDDFEEKIVEHMKKHDVGLIVLAGFMCILKGAVLAEYKNRIINVHPSLIPSFCGDGFYGLKVHEAALSYGVKVTGATVHFVNEVTDGGAIILQKSVEIKEGDTPEALQKRVMEEAEWKILPKAVHLFCEGRIEIVGNKTVILRGQG